MTEPRNRSVESYAHKAAKAAMIGWLRDFCTEVQGCELPGVAGLACWEPMTWLVDAGDAALGIHAEVPFCATLGALDWRLAFPDLPDRPPTRDEMIARGRHPGFILDVGIFEAGRLRYGVEIVHRHPVSVHKAELIRRSGVTVLEVRADWVLRQVRRPRVLRFERLFGAFGALATADARRTA